MKKQLLLLLSFSFISAPLMAQPDLNRKSFYYQKQILISEDPSASLATSCQAISIAKDWLLTAAHCVLPYTESEGCNVRIILAHTDTAVASATIDCSDVILPQSDEETGPVPFDLALLHYVDGSVPYEYMDEQGKPLSPKDFSQALGKDKKLQNQWRNRVPSRFPTLYTTNKTAPQTLVNSLVVARVEDEKFSYLGSRKRPFFFGKTAPALWVTDDFGVEQGNSGGGVMALLKDDSLGLLGIVSAAPPNFTPGELLARVRPFIPDFGSTEKYFVFYGFDEHSSMPFIRQVLQEDGQEPRVKRLQAVYLPNAPEAQTYQLKAK